MNGDYRIRIKGWSELNVFVVVVEIFESAGCVLDWSSIACEHFLYANKKLIFACDQNCREERIWVPLSTGHTGTSKTQTGRKTLAVFESSLLHILIWLFWPHVLNIPDILARCIKYTKYQSRSVFLNFFRCEDEKLLPNW